MALLAGTLSLPFSTNQATALKPRVYPFGTDQPEAAIGLGECVDFDAGELDAPLAQGPEGFDRPLEKIRAELLVCQNLADDQLHGSLRHDLHAVGRLPRYRGAFSTSLPSRRRKSNVAAAVRIARNPRKSAGTVGRGRFEPSEYRRGARQRAADGGANINHPALATAVTVAQKPRLPEDIVERETKAPSSALAL